MLVQGIDKLVSLDVRGKMGFSAGCGIARCGYSRCGASARFGGIYSRKKTLKGWKTSRMKYYAPTNPQTEAQTARRSLFAMGVSAWQGLTDLDKVYYNKVGRKYRMTGFNFFMRWYLRQG